MTDAASRTRGTSDRGAADLRGQPEQDRRRWLGLVAIALGVAIVIADATVVNVAVPTIVADLRLTTTDAEWVNSVYSLVFAALLVTVGRLGDLYGRRRLLVVGMAVFVAASVVCALAQNGGELIGGRVLQGIGAAMLLPSTLSSVNATFTGRDRGIAFAVYGSTIGGMAAVGPLLGGWLTTSFSWRWAFGINVVVGAVVVLGVRRFVPETRDEHAERGQDLPGVLLSAVGLGLLVFGLIEGQRYGWWRAKAAADEIGWSASLSPVVPALALSVVLVAAFVLVEVRRRARGKVVVLDLDLFAIPSFRNGNIAATVISLGEFGLLFALPLYLQDVLGYSAVGTGLVLVALALGSFVSAGGAAPLTAALGPRAVVRIGLLLEAVGIGGIALFVGTGISAWRLVPWLFVYGVGVGLATAQLTGVILADVPVERSGQASGTQSTARQLGSALGIAILGAVLVGSLGSDGRSRLEAAGVPEPERSAVVSATQQSAGVAISGFRKQRGPGDVVVVALEDAFVDSTRRVGLTAAAFVLLGLLASFSLGTGREPETGPQEERERAR